MGFGLCFLSDELTNLIGEWIEEERLNALDVASPSVPSDPSTKNAAEIRISSAETSEQSSMVKVKEVTAAPDPSFAHEVPITEPSSSVPAIQPLINLEEEPEAPANPSPV